MWSKAGRKREDGYAGLDPLAEIKAGITSALEAADKPALPPGGNPGHRRAGRRQIRL